MKWSLVWGTWAAAFAVAETVAIRSGDPTAPLSYHLRLIFGTRRNTAHHRVGQLAFAGGVSWVALHLWRDVIDEIVAE